MKVFHWCEFASIYSCLFFGAVSEMHKRKVDMKRLALMVACAFFGGYVSAFEVQVSTYQLRIKDNGEDDAISYSNLNSCLLVLKHAVGMPEKADFVAESMYEKEEAGYSAGCFKKE